MRKTIDGNASGVEIAEQKRGRDVEAFYQDELNVLNRLKKNDGVAPFLGVAGANVYLVFGYQGSTTLEMCLRKRRIRRRETSDEGTGNVGR